MTKRRPPLTFDAALARIAGHIGWAEMAHVASQAIGRPVSERTVRYYGDPDADLACPVPIAVALDVAFMAAGGTGAPMHETYSLMLETAHAARFADQLELSVRTSRAIKEVGEAGAALVLCTLPGATADDRREALREVEEGIAALRDTTPLLAAHADMAEAASEVPGVDTS